MKAPSLSERLADSIRHCYPLWLLLRKPVPVTLMRGATRGGPASVLFAALDSQPSPLARRLFVGEVNASIVGTVPVWRLDSFLRNPPDEADLTMIRVDERSARRLFPSDYLRVPDWVDTTLAVPDEVETLWKANGSLADDIRRVRSKKIERVMSTADGDLDFFYRTMYLPFNQGRHGDLAVVHEEAWVRHCLQNGKLLWAVSGTEKLAGGIVEISGGGLHFRVMGTRGGDPELMRTGAVAALYLFVIRYARELGLPFVSFGPGLASLRDGVLRYKRKWVAVISPRPSNRFYTLIRWPRWSPAVAGFLEDSAVLHEDGSTLRALTARTSDQPGSQAELDRIHHELHTSGVGPLVIVSPSGWQPRLAPPPCQALPSCVALMEGGPSVSDCISFRG